MPSKPLNAPATNTSEHAAPTRSDPASADPVNGSIGGPRSPAPGEARRRQGNHGPDDQHHAVTANQNQSSTPSKASARGQAIRSWPLVLLAFTMNRGGGVVRLGRHRPDDRIRPGPPPARYLGLTAPGLRDHPAHRRGSLWRVCAAGLAIGQSTVMPAARRFARWSAIASLLLGMAGQIAYHLLTETGTVRAPWAITTAVSCLPSSCSAWAPPSPTCSVPNLPAHRPTPAAPAQPHHTRLPANCRNTGRATSTAV